MGQVLVSLRPWVGEVRLLTELTVPQLRAMLLLHSEGPMRMSDLAGRLTMGSPVVTSLVARLEEKGLVTRQHTRDDRRVVTCSCTESGRREAETFFGGLDERISELVATLSEDELEAVARGLELMVTGGQSGHTVIRDRALPLQPAPADAKRRNIRENREPA